LARREPNGVGRRKKRQPGRGVAGLVPELALWWSKVNLSSPNFVVSLRKMTLGTSDDCRSNVTHEQDHQMPSDRLPAHPQSRVPGDERRRGCWVTGVTSPSNVLRSTTKRQGGPCSSRSSAGPCRPRVHHLSATSLHRPRSQPGPGGGRVSSTGCTFLDYAGNPVGAGARQGRAEGQVIHRAAPRSPEERRWWLTRARRSDVGGQKSGSAPAP